MRDEEIKKRAAQQHANNRAFFCEHFPKGGIGAEIGVFYGQFSEIILQIAKPKLLYLVDPWLHDDKFGNRTKEQINEIYLEIRSKFKKNSNIEIVRCDSFVFWLLYRNEISKKRENLLDFIYVDGDHNYNTVIGDLARSWDIVKPGGIISGDDYGENIPLWGDSIKRAVDDFCRKKGITPKLFNVTGEIGKQFLIRR